MNDRGSALIETVIATAVLAMILGGAYQVLGDAARRAAQADVQRTALMIAQSRLAELPLTRPVTPGTTAGLSDGLSWRVVIRPAGSAPTPLSVRVEVAQPGVRRPIMALTTLRPGRTG